MHRMVRVSGLSQAEIETLTKALHKHGAIINGIVQYSYAVWSFFVA